MARAPDLMDPRRPRSSSLGAGVRGQRLHTEVWRPHTRTPKVRQQVHLPPQGPRVFPVPNPLTQLPQGSMWKEEPTERLAKLQRSRADRRRHVALYYTSVSHQLGAGTPLTGSPAVSPRAGRARRTDTYTGPSTAAPLAARRPSPRPRRGISAEHRPPPATGRFGTPGRATPRAAAPQRRASHEGGSGGGGSGGGAGSGVASVGGGRPETPNPGYMGATRSTAMRAEVTAHERRRRPLSPTISPRPRRRLPQPEARPEHRPKRGTAAQQYWSPPRGGSEGSPQRPPQPWRDTAVRTHSAPTGGRRSPPTGKSPARASSRSPPANTPHEDPQAEGPGPALSPRSAQMAAAMLHRHSELIERAKDTIAGLGLSPESGPSGSVSPVRVGARVMRNDEHWKWGAQDGGPGSQGTVVYVEDGWASVRWDATNRTNSYRVGHSGAWDLQGVSVHGGRRQGLHSDLETKLQERKHGGPGKSSFSPHVTSPASPPRSRGRLMCYFRLVNVADEPINVSIAADQPLSLLLPQLPGRGALVCNEVPIDLGRTPADLGLPAVPQPTDADEILPNWVVCTFEFVPEGQVHERFRGLIFDPHAGAVDEETYFDVDVPGSSEPARYRLRQDAVMEALQDVLPSRATLEWVRQDGECVPVNLSSTPQEQGMPVGAGNAVRLCVVATPGADDDGALDVSAAEMSTPPQHAPVAADPPKPHAPPGVEGLPTRPMEFSPPEAAPLGGAASDGEGTPRTPRRVTFMSDDDKPSSPGAEVREPDDCGVGGARLDEEV